MTKINRVRSSMRRANRAGNRRVRRVYRERVPSLDPQDPWVREQILRAMLEMIEQWKHNLEDKGLI